MNALLLFCGLVVIIIIVGLFFILGHTHNEPKQSAKRIEGLNFIPSQMYMGSDGLGGLAVNERTHQICLFKSTSSPPRLFPIADLIGSFLIKNGELVGEGKRSYPKEIVTFGKELHRQKESLIKNLDISSTNSNQRIDLLVAVHDPEEPILAVNFLDMETKKGGILFEKAMSTATHWHYVLDGLILEADRVAQLQSGTAQDLKMVKTTS